MSFTNEQMLFENQIEPKPQRKYKRVKRFPYKLYIPENLEIDALLAAHPPTFSHHRDYFIYILHLISSIPMWIRDFDIEKHKGFTPVDKKYLSRRIHDYKRYIEYLRHHRIIIEGTSYKPGYYATGLKFAEPFRTTVRGVLITKNTLIKSITERVDNRDIETENRLEFLKKWFNPSLTIDMDWVIAYLIEDMKQERDDLLAKRSKQRIKKSKVPVDDVVIFGYNMKYMVADKINDGKHLRLKIDSTSGRFHSPLTNLKKELRQYIRYNNEELYGIDIVNSQPLLAMVVLDYDLFTKNKIYEIIAHYNNTFTDLKDYNKLSNPTRPSSTMLVNLIKKCGKAKDVQIFKQSVVEGRFYERFGELLEANNLIPSEILGNDKKIRKFAKTAIFNAFFSKPSDVIWNKYIQAFRKCFPNVYRIFSLIKSGEGKHSTLALLLQRFESNLVLNGVCEEINRIFPNSPLFTIHDSIATTAENVPAFETIFKKHLFEALGVVPLLQVENF